MRICIIDGIIFRTWLSLYDLKKAFAILFVSIYLLYTTQISQLLKLPLLVEHYFEHKRIDQCITFFEFMQMHYLMDESKNPDYARDMQLPFKTIEVNLITTFVLIPSLELQLDREDLDLHSALISKRLQWYSGMFMDHIWQPPRSRA